MIRYVIAIPFAALLTLGACTPDQAQQAQTTQAKIAAAINEGCGAVNAAAAVAAPFAAIPQIAGILTFAQAGCGTAEAVAALTTKAVNDPSTIAWVQQLAGDINAAVARVRG